MNSVNNNKHNEYNSITMFKNTKIYNIVYINQYQLQKYTQNLSQNQSTSIYTLHLFIKINEWTEWKKKKCKMIERLAKGSEN